MRYTFFNWLAHLWLPNHAIFLSYIHNLLCCHVQNSVSINKFNMYVLVHGTQCISIVFLVFQCWVRISPESLKLEN
jgi:hypothetical protein